MEKILSEDYCSYEVAKLLKEKGFDESCNSFYLLLDNGDYRYTMSDFPYKNSGKYNVSSFARPTHQMAMKWLREKGIYLNIRIALNHMDGDVINNIHWVVDILDFSSGEWKDNDIWADTYEEAVEAALKYVLKNLI